MLTLIFVDLFQYFDVQVVDSVVDAAGGFAGSFSLFCYCVFSHSLGFYSGEAPRGGGGGGGICPSP